MTSKHIRQAVGEQIVEHYRRHLKTTRYGGSGSWRFETNCIGSDSESIQNMVDAARPVTYETMLRTVGRPFVELQGELGYDIDGKRDTGLRMKNDWHVGYFKSVYRGRPCYYFVWSAIEHIFTPS